MLAAMLGSTGVKLVASSFIEVAANTFPLEVWKKYWKPPVQKRAPFSQGTLSNPSTRSRETTPDLVLMVVMYFTPRAPSVLVAWVIGPSNLRVDTTLLLLSNNAEPTTTVSLVTSVAMYTTKKLATQKQQATRMHTSAADLPDATSAFTSLILR